MKIINIKFFDKTIKGLKIINSVLYLFPWFSNKRKNVNFHIEFCHGLGGPLGLIPRHEIDKFG